MVDFGEVLNLSNSTVPDLHRQKVVKDRQGTKIPHQYHFGLSRLLPPSRSLVLSPRRFFGLSQPVVIEDPWWPVTGSKTVLSVGLGLTQVSNEVRNVKMV